MTTSSCENPERGEGLSLLLKGTVSFVLGVRPGSRPKLTRQRLVLNAKRRMPPAKRPLTSKSGDFVAVVQNLLCSTLCTCWSIGSPLGLVRNTPLRRDHTAQYSTSFVIAKTCESICTSLSHVQKAPLRKLLSSIGH